MTNFIHHNTCPLCGSNAISNQFKVKDHTVSGAEFNIFQCKDCGLRFTQDAPDAISSGVYYKSEEYISHSDTSKGLINRIYRFVRKYSLKQKRNLVRKVAGISRGLLLDVGSGTGYFVREMKEAGWEVTGLEPDDHARQLAGSENKVDLKPIQELFRLEPSGFHIITLWHVLEHVHDLHGYIKQFKSLLKPSGKLIIAVPNYESYDARAYRHFWAAYDVPRHLYHFNTESIKRLMNIHGLSVISIQPMWFDSYYVSLLSSRYENGKTKWLPALWRGMISNFKALGNVEKCSSLIYVIGQIKNQKFKI